MGGVCCSDMPLPEMVLKNEIRYLLMEYRNDVRKGKFYVEYDTIQDAYDELDSEGFVERAKLSKDYMESLHNLKKELVIMMALFD